MCVNWQVWSGSLALLGDFPGDKDFLTPSWSGFLLHLTYLHITECRLLGNPIVLSAAQEILVKPPRFPSPGTGEQRTGHSSFQCHSWAFSCPSRMLSKADSAIPPPPRAPAPVPPGTITQVDVRSRVAAWSAWASEQGECEYSWGEKQ